MQLIWTIQTKAQHRYAPKRAPHLFIYAPLHNATTFATLPLKVVPVSVPVENMHASSWPCHELANSSGVVPLPSPFDSRDSLEQTPCDPQRRRRRV